MSKPDQVQQGAFTAPGATVTWRTDDRGLTLTQRGRAEFLPWNTISRSGLLVFEQTGDTGAIPTAILPGLQQLFEVNHWMAVELRQLLLAVQTPRTRLLRVPILLRDPDAVALVEALQAYLGERWLGDISLQEQYTRLGVQQPWWTIPLAALIVLVGVPACLLAILAYAALQESPDIDISPIAWAALAAWGLLVGGVYWIYRRYMR